jgi:hypothetical protein
MILGSTVLEPVLRRTVVQNQVVFSYYPDDTGEHCTGTCVKENCGTESDSI